MDYLFRDFRLDEYVSIFRFFTIFFIIVGALVLRATEYRQDLFLRQDRNWLLVFVLFMIFLAGTRGIKVGTDTSNYYQFYFLPGIRIDNITDFFKYFDTDFLFKVVMYLTFYFKSYTFFLISIALIINITLYKFVRKFTNNGKEGSSLLLFLAFASSFSFIQLEMNIIRNGLSISFILLAIHYILQRNFKLSVVFFVIAFLFHSTAIIPIAVILIATFSSRIRITHYMGVYIVGVLLAFLDFGFHKIAFLTSLEAEDFQKLSFSGETTYRIGFRLDFVLYNSFFLFLFMKFGDLKNKTQVILVKYFILTSVIFFFNFGIPFSDRVGLYSWIAIPILLFTTANFSFPDKNIYISSLVVLFYFLINNVILFP